MTHNLRLHVHLPDNATLLAAISTALNGNSFPPGMPSPKGFLKHMTSQSIVGDTLICEGYVDSKYLEPVIRNAGKAVFGTMILAMLASIPADTTLGIVKVAIDAVDMTSNRAVYFSVSQDKADIEEVMRTNATTKPSVEYLMVLDATQPPEAEPARWTGTLNELLETLIAHFQREDANVH